MSLSGIGKGLVKGLGFLGGGNPLKGAIGVGGAIAGGLASGGRQSQVNTTGAQTQASTQATQQNQTGTVNVQESELPELSPFRRGTMQAFQQELQQARQPVFDQAMQANFVGRVNDTTNQAFDQINQRLASRGVGAGGGLRRDTTELELARGAQLSDFFSQLPFKEAEARAQRVNPLLQAGLSFAGRGPGGTTQTNNLQTTGNTQGNVQTDSTQGVETRGPGALGGILGELGDLAAGGLARGTFDNEPDPFDESLIDRPSGIAPGNVALPTDITRPNVNVGQTQPLPFQIFPQSNSVQTPLFFSRR